VKGHLGGAFVEPFAIIVQHQAACTASTNLVITPSSEVQKMHRLLYMKLDLQNFSTMYTMQKDLSKFGLHIAVKLNNIDLPHLNV
jgi:hypothetical protein